MLHWGVDFAEYRPYKQIMIFEYENIKNYLQDEFASRIKKNPRYSLRSFAQFLQVHPAELSMIFKGKRNLSLNSALKVAKAMGLNQQESEHLLKIVQKEKVNKLNLDFSFLEKTEIIPIDIERFAQVCNWYHFAILNLIDTRAFIWSAAEISRRLGISVSEANMAMDDLLKSGLVEIEQKNRRLLAKAVQVHSQYPSHTIRKYHRQMIEKSLIALDEVRIDKREYQSIGFVTNAESLESIKTEIRNFSQHIAKKFHKTGGKDVYQIQVNLFPISKEQV